MMKRIGRLEPSDASELALGIEELKAAYGAGTLVVPPSQPPRRA